MNYSEKIKYARRALLMRREELAYELGVTLVTVCHWEDGKAVPCAKSRKAFRELCERRGLFLDEDDG